MKNNNYVEYAKIDLGLYFHKVENHFEPSSKVHFHNVYEIFLLTGGKRDYIVNGKNYIANKGSVVFIPPGLVHVTSGDIFCRKLIHFSADAMASFLNKDFLNNLLSNVNIGLYNFNETISNKINDLFSEIEKNYIEKAHSNFAFNTALLLQTLIDSENINVDVESTSIISRVIKYIENHYNDPITLDFLSTHFNISKYYLCHCFYDEKKISIMKYLNKFRIERSAELLKDTAMPLSTISSLCGFQNEYYFSVKFKQEIGISPLKYRKIFKK